MKKNLPVSVRQRLLNLSQAAHEPFDRFTNRFAIERLLYRLSVSPYAGRFVLKGAMLFVAWDSAPHRPTRDVDFLGFGPAETEELKKVFRELCAQPVPDDGVVFDPNSVSVEAIRESDAYGGIRVKLNAHLGTARIPLQADVGFGDAVTPATEEIKFPVLFDEFESPRLRAYPVYTVIAEKFEAMIRLGDANTRLKDFYDLWFLTRADAINETLVTEAVRATFERRKTALPTDVPRPLADDFAASREAQWKGFLTRNGLPESIRFGAVVATIRQRLVFIWTR